MERLTDSELDALEELCEHYIPALLAEIRERRAAEATGGLWRCSGCGEAKDDSPAWRWNGESWEHRCPGNHSQHDEPARYFGTAATGTRVVSPEPLVRRNCIPLPPEEQMEAELERNGWSWQMWTQAGKHYWWHPNIQTPGTLSTAEAWRRMKGL